MSAYRAAALRLLERTYALPKALRLRETWAELDDAELDALLRLRFDFGDGVAAPSPAQHVADRLRELLSAADDPLRRLTVQQVLAVVNYFREQFPTDTELAALLDALIGAAVARRQVAEDASARQRERASKPRKTNQDRAAPYTRIALEVLSSDRYVGDSKKATRERQSAAFERRVIAQKLQPISESTRRRRMEDARKLLASQQPRC